MQRAVTAILLWLQDLMVDSVFVTSNLADNFPIERLTPASHELRAAATDSGDGEFAGDAGGCWAAGSQLAAGCSASAGFTLHWDASPLRCLLLARAWCQVSGENVTRSPALSLARAISLFSFKQPGEEECGTSTFSDVCRCRQR